MNALVPGTGRVAVEHGKLRRFLFPDAAFIERREMICSQRFSHSLAALR